MGFFGVKGPQGLKKRRATAANNYVTQTLLMDVASLGETLSTKLRAAMGMGDEDNKGAPVSAAGPGPANTATSSGSCKIRLPSSGASAVSTASLKRAKPSN